MAKLKVYGWTSFRQECPPAPNNSKQTREICAATSQAALSRLLNRRIASFHQFAETGNKAEIAAAIANPGIVLWRPLNARGGEWHKAE